MEDDSINQDNNDFIREWLYPRQRAAGRNNLHVRENEESDNNGAPILFPVDNDDDEAASVQDEADGQLAYSRARQDCDPEPEPPVNRGGGDADNGGNGCGDGNERRSESADRERRSGDATTRRRPRAEGGGGGGGGGGFGMGTVICGIILVIVVIGVVDFFINGNKSYNFEVKLASQAGCQMNENMNGMLNKAGCRMSADYQKKFLEFQKAIKDSECLQGEAREACGLVNYIDTMAGGIILGIGETKTIQNPLLCKCKDQQKDKDKEKVKEGGSLACLPKDGKCKSCVCDEIGVETIIRDEPLRMGHCWAFTGMGEVSIGMFFPIHVWGFTVRHPTPESLPPGFATSAPKDFEFMGIGGKDNNSTHSFGMYQYRLGKGSTQIFEVKYPSSDKFSQVKFRFTSNHGKNYTAIYKLEVHGYLEQPGGLN